VLRGHAPSGGIEGPALRPNPIGGAIMVKIRSVIARGVMAALRSIGATV